MSTQSVPQNRGKHHHSTREIKADERYCRLLAEDLGIEAETARECFLGEPQKRALGVIAWTFKHAPDDPEKRSKMVMLWARKNQTGSYREQNGHDDAELDIARKIAAYWTEHPEALADTLKAALNRCEGCGEASGSISAGTGAPLVHRDGRWTHVSCLPAGDFSRMA